MTNFWHSLPFQFFPNKVHDKSSNIDDGVSLEAGEVGFPVSRLGEPMERVQGLGHCAVNIGGDQVNEDGIHPHPNPPLLTVRKTRSKLTLNNCQSNRCKIHVFT